MLDLFEDATLLVALLLELLDERLECPIGSLTSAHRL